MTDLRQAAQMALEALERIDQADNDCDFLNPSQCYQLDAAITALRAALAEQPDVETCEIPPLGWHCTRHAGHEGPCAAVANDDRELVSRAMKRLAEQPAEQEPVAVARPDPNCPTCHGTGVDGDSADDGSTIDVDCGCLKHLAPMPKPPWDGTYKDKCEDGKRCLQGCRSSERCYWVRKAPAPQPAKRVQLTDEEITAIAFTQHNYPQGTVGSAMFRKGVRYAEAAHGITGETE